MGACHKVLGEYNTGHTELVALVNMLHILSYGQQGGWRVGGCDNVLDENNTGPTELVAAALSLWPRLCRKHFGTDASRGEENGWMIWWKLAWET